MIYLIENAFQSCFFINIKIISSVYSKFTGWWVIIPGKKEANIKFYWGDNKLIVSASGLDGLHKYSIFHSFIDHPLRIWYLLKFTFTFTIVMAHSIHFSDSFISNLFESNKEMQFIHNLKFLYTEGRNS